MLMLSLLYWLFLYEIVLKRQEQKTNSMEIKCYSNVVSSRLYFGLLYVLNVNHDCMIKLYVSIVDGRTIGGVKRTQTIEPPLNMLSSLLTFNVEFSN